MTRKLKHVYIFTLDVYGVGIILVVNRTQKWFLDHLKKKHKFKVDDEIYEEADGLCVVHQTESTYAVWLKEFNWRIDDFATLAHELTHVALRIIDNTDIPFRIENEEVFAYLMGALTKHAMIVLPLEPEK